MQHRFVLALCFTGIALLVPGCQRRLNLDKTVTLTAGGIEVPAIVDGPRRDQKVRVSVTSAVPVNVDVVLEGNRAAVMEALQAGKRPTADQVLASKERLQADAVSATIPAGKEFAVVLSGATKQTEVKVSVQSE
jgi:hypothetical protein